MEIAVLVKAVPDVEQLAFDPTRRTLVRSHGELRPNAFDQRALRVALEFAGPADTVTVWSMGPPNAEGPLREALALGARSATLWTDPRLAGADVLATSRLLAHGLGPSPPDLVLAGARSLDSDTGLVGPTVAALLGRPMAAQARSLHRTEDGEGIEVVVDTPRGRARLRLPLPAVVTVGEKATKPLRLTEAQRSSLGSAVVRHLGAEASGLEPDQWGARGSPTSVVAVDVSPARRMVRTFREGAVAERVAAAVDLVRDRWALPPPAPGPFRSPLGSETGREIRVVVTDDRGTLDAGMLGWLSEIRRGLRQHWPSAIWLGDPPNGEERQRLANAGALQGFRSAFPGPRVDPEEAAAAIGGPPGSSRPVAALLLPATPFGRETLSRFCAPRGLGVVGDCTELEEAADGALRFLKPSFGNRTVASIACRTVPGGATVALGCHREATAAQPPIPFHELPRDGAIAPRARWTSEDVDPPDAVDPTSAPVVVAVGMGVGSPEGLNAVRSVATRWHAAVVGTRRVVDSGWLPAHRQVGVTGRALAPRLAVLLGVRGSAHHMAGWRRAETVLAVNADPAAPVFDEADVGILGPLEEVLPLLSERLAVALGV